jgi:hypothetical protein
MLVEEDRVEGGYKVVELRLQEKIAKYTFVALGVNATL